MTKRFCPIIHEDCENGTTKESEAPCVLWDSIYGECSYSQSLLLACQTQRMVLDPVQSIARELKAPKLGSKTG